MKKILKRTLIYMVIVIFCIIAVFPIYWLVITSLTPTDKLFISPPIFVPTENPIIAYYNYLVESSFLTWLGNNIKIGSVVLLLTLILIIPAAYGLSRFEFKGKAAATFMILLTQMLPLVFILIPIYILFTRLKMNNNLWALIIINTAIVLPVCIWFLKGFFDGVPRELEEAAIIDGCNRLNALLRVIMPMTLPGIAATMTWALIIVWDEYMFAYTFIDSEKLFTLSVGLGGYIGQYSTPWNLIMTGSFLCTIPVALAFVFFQKYIVSGLTTGAVKG